MKIRSTMAPVGNVDLFKTIRGVGIKLEVVGWCKEIPVTSSLLISSMCQGP